MRPLTLFLRTLLALTSSIFPAATAHKDKGKAERLEELNRDYYAHTWEANVVNRMVFGYTLDDFMNMWNNRVGEYGMTDLVWWSDACTGVDDTPLGWGFKPACIRHDFGYENFRRQGRLSDEARKKIDVNFRGDLFDICDKYPTRKACRVQARLYYTGVRLWGKNDRHRIIIINAVSTNTTSTNATIAADADTDTGSEERSVDKVAGGYWFVDWLGDLMAHPELLMEMTERELDNVGMALDAGMEEIEKKRDE